MGVRGPKSKIEEISFVECHMESLWAKKWLDSVEKQKKRKSDLKEQRDIHPDRHPDRQTEATTKDKAPSLGAESTVPV